MAKTRWLDRRIARPGPYLALCLSESEFRRALKHLKVKPQSRWLNSGADATMHTYENPSKETVCIVCLGDVAGRQPVEIAGMLVHEAVHVWQQYCNDMGEDSPATEQEAYGIQSIAQELLTEYARRLP